MHGKTPIAELNRLRRSKSRIAAPNNRSDDKKDVTLGSAHFLRGDALVAINQVPARSCDLIVSSPPYNIGKDYERDNDRSFEEYIAWQDEIIGALVTRLKKSGSIC